MGDGTFYQTPRDMLEKLQRECDRHTRAGAYQPEARDSAVNGIWTAAHIADWVFHALSNAEKAALGPGGRSEARFAECVGHRLPAVRYCRSLCNAAKHFKLGRSSPLGHSHAKVTGVGTPAVGEAAIGEFPSHLSIEISIDGSKIPARASRLLGASLVEWRPLIDALESSNFIAYWKSLPSPAAVGAGYFL